MLAKNQTLTSIQTSTKSTSLSNNLKNKKNNPQKRKSVTFSRQVLVHPILSCNDYTDKEFQACWYSSDDKCRIRREANQILKQMNKVEDQEDSSSSSDNDYHGKTDNKSTKSCCCSCFASCTRGLEFQTQQGAKTRQHRRQRAYNAVFDIQEEQFNENILDEYEIAIAYSKLTAESKLQAYMMGLADAQHDNHMAKRNPSVLSGGKRMSHSNDDECSFCLTRKILLNNEQAKSSSYSCSFVIRRAESFGIERCC